MMPDNLYSMAGGQRKGSVKSQTYQGAATNYEQPGSVSQVGHVKSASELGCWVRGKRKGSAVRNRKDQP